MRWLNDSKQDSDHLVFLQQKIQSNWSYLMVSTRFFTGDGKNSSLMNNWKLLTATDFVSWTVALLLKPILTVSKWKFILVTEPWVPLKVLQNFIGVQEFITKQNFVLPPGGKGLPCFTEDKSKDHVDCLGEGKGRTMEKRFSKDVNDALHALFKPFDDYFAKKILHQKPFNWNFGNDEL